MLVRSILKTTSALAGLTYVGSHGYLAYHLAFGKVTDPMSRVSSDAVSINASKERKHVVDAVVGLYQLKYSNEKMMVYSPDAIFEDPFARLESRDALASGMSMMLSAFKKSETLHFDATHGQDNIILELTQEYTLRGLGLKLRVPSVIYLTLRGPPGDEQIIEHVEEWGGKALLKNDGNNTLNIIPEKLRKVNGVVSTAIFPIPAGLKE